MSPSPDELRGLMVACRRGDERSARRLHALVSPALLGVARVIVREEPLAMDVVQSVYLKLLAMPKKALRGVASPMPWLVTLTRNEARDVMRARGRAERREREAPPRALAMESNPQQALRHAIGALPGELAELVVLKHAGGMTFDEIASALDVNRNTAASRYRRALELLRERLTGPDERQELETSDAR